MLQDGITLELGVVGAGMGALVGGTVGFYGSALFGHPVDGGATRGAIAGCLLGTVLGAVHCHRTALLALLAFEVHWGEDEPPKRPWRGWS